MSIKLLVVDDHAIFREGLVRLLRDENDFTVVGEAGDGHQAVECVREWLPDIVLMDVGMPVLNGIEATREICREAPGVKVVALSRHSAGRYVWEMCRAGACGYLTKDCGFAELAAAIRTVAEGKTYVGSLIRDVATADRPRVKEGIERDAFVVLTQREREVLQLLAEGNDTRQIAAYLRISPHTVRAHTLRVMNKLEIDSIALLTKYAVYEGLTSPEPSKAGVKGKTGVRHHFKL